MINLPQSNVARETDFLPKKHLKSPHGQILILFLLVLVLGMAIVLSVASRTVTDIKVTTTSDESNRAYFAAEAGVEEALERAKDPAAPETFQLTLDFDDISTTAQTDVNIATGARETYIYPFLVERDDVAQVNMLRTYPNLSTGWGGSVLTIWWGTDPDGANGHDQAIEVSVLYHTAANFYITKFGFDKYAFGHMNNFCSASPGVQQESSGVELEDSQSGIPRTFYFSATVDIRAVAPGVQNVQGCANSKHGLGIGATDPVFLRIRPLYNVEPVPIAIVSPSPLVPNQGVIIESTGKTESGVTRKIEVTSTYPAMPAIFDYVLLNGGTDALTKN